MYEIIYKLDMVLINAFYYSFWMKISEYNKYIIKKNNKYLYVL